MIVLLLSSASESHVLYVTLESRDNVTVHKYYMANAKLSERKFMMQAFVL